MKPRVNIKVINLQRVNDTVKIGPEMDAEHKEKVAQYIEVIGQSKAPSSSAALRCFWSRWMRVS